MDRQSETILLLAAHSVRFIADHPYASVGIFGAMVGSALTYKAMSVDRQRSFVDNIFTPKAYRIALSTAELKHLLEDPEAELRWDTPEMSVIITSEEAVPLKALPVIEQKPTE